ncbi:hypothetical protein E2C01_094745 [Portunus trituberculatus]|uniref:Uncharacterized protein n=1 Tax=Portunus trituberculatus TaxID=210409 RepID=A0A5B7K1P1_PORTR|nr:hypothetical protein [Portunus trituberculatus]
MSQESEGDCIGMKEVERGREGGKEAGGGVPSGSHHLAHLGLEVAHGGFPPHPPPLVYSPTKTITTTPALQPVTLPLLPGCITNHLPLILHPFATWQPLHSASPSLPLPPPSPPPLEQPST